MGLINRIVENFEGYSRELIDHSTNKEIIDLIVRKRFGESEKRIYVKQKLRGRDFDLDKFTERMQYFVANSVEFYNTRNINIPFENFTNKVFYIIEQLAEIYKKQEVLVALQATSELFFISNNSVKSHSFKTNFIRGLDLSWLCQKDFTGVIVYTLIIEETEPKNIEGVMLSTITLPEGAKLIT
jgi:hypothetical protein